MFGMICLLAVLVSKAAPREVQKKFVHNLALSPVTKEFWRVEEGKYCRVYYEEGQEEAEMTMRIADSYYPMVSADFGWNRKEKLDFMLYQDGADMGRALGMNEGEPLPMGAYYSGLVVVLSPSQWTKERGNWQQTEEFLEKGPVVHEMVHFALDEKAGGAYPLWFSEGVALYYEKKYTGFEWRKDLKGYCDSISMEDLTYRFQELDTAAAYRKSYECVTGFVEKYGEKALQQRIVCINSHGNNKGK